MILDLCALLLRKRSTRSSVRRIKVPDEKAVILEEKFALEAFEHGGVVGDGRIQNLQRDYPAGLAVADLPPRIVPFCASSKRVMDFLGGAYEPEPFSISNIFI